MTEAGRHFRFIRPIASGGFGTVYLAKEEHPDGFTRVVAIKLLNAQWSDCEEVGGRIRDEARLLGLLRHRNIVDVYDLTSLDGRSAVVMEYLEAVDLRYLSKHLESQNAKIPVRPALEIVAQVAHALDAAYNRPPMPGDKPLRVIHRDIKPSNIMLDAHGLPKVLDFGVAQSEIVSRESSTQDLQFGSVDYMAPERLFFEPETPASDVYSLAATLFELITGERLGKAQGRASKHDAHLASRMSFMRARADATPEVAAGLEALLLHTLHFEHDHRPDASSFCQEARQLARRIETDDLVIWAEGVMPGVLAASQTRGGEEDPLANAVLAEDSVGRERDLPTAELPSVRDVPEPVAARESARAAALRRGALAELEASGEFEIAPETGAPKLGLGTMVPEGADNVGWDDRTMGDLTDAEVEATEEAAYPADLENMGMTTGGFETAETEETLIPEPPKTMVDADTMQGMKPVMPKSSWTYIAAGAFLPLLAVVGLVVGALWKDWGGLRTQVLGLDMAGQSTAQAPAPDASTSIADAADILSEEDPEGGIIIRSAWARTQTVRVRCKEGGAKGDTMARLDRQAASRCEITAIRKDKSRLTAVLGVLNEGEYVCFVDGAKECQPK